MYGDRSMSSNHITAAAVAGASVAGGLYLGAPAASVNVKQLQPHPVFDQRDLLPCGRKTTVSTVPEVVQTPGPRYSAGAYCDILAASSSVESFTSPAAGPTTAFHHHRKCLNSFYMSYFLVHAVTWPLRNHVRIF